MNVKQLGAVAVIAAVSVAGAAFVLRSAPQGVASDRRGAIVVPGLLAKANDVASITIRDSEKAFTVEKRANGFFDKDSNYPVKPEAFRDLVAGASTLAFEEQKTSDPTRYADLGLADPAGDAAPEKKGREVTLRDDKGGALASLIVGNRDSTVGGARGGVYLRFPNDRQTWLARGEVRVPVPHTAWFEINLINLNRDALARIELRGGGLDDITAVAEKKGEDLKLQDVPEGRAADTGKVLRLSFMVDPISFQDVRKPQGEPKADARRMFVWGHNGLKVTYTSVGELADGWVRLAVEATSEESKAQAAELAPKIDGFEFKLSKNDSDQLGWTLKDVTTEPKS